MTRAKMMAQAIALGLCVASGGAWAADPLASLDNAGVQGDCARATALVAEIEQAGEPEALMVLGGRFEEGRPCLDPDPVRAVRLYLRAAETGEAGKMGAMARLGRLHLGGRGVPQDLAQAKHWFRAAVLAAVGVAPPRRRELLAMALEGEVPDPLARQLTWLVLIERGGARSQFDLAMRLRTGDGVPRNEAAADYLVLKLAAEAYPPALYEYGRRRLSKAKVPGERVLAFADMRAAAEHGYLPAMLDLAGRMLEGRGLERDDFGAYVAFLKARAKGAAVEDELDLLEERMDFVEMSVAREHAKRSGNFPIGGVKD